MRIGDLLDAERLAPRLKAVLEEKNAWIVKVHGEEGIDFDKELERFIVLGERLRPFVGDTGSEVRRAARADKNILFEGAQGALLDIDHGTYPFVTSSNTGTAGIAAGAGFPANQIGGAYGIAKAYCTRVGEGPFPTEDHGPLGQKLRDEGNEYGATTGRPRRCGWFDAVATQYTCEINGATGLVVTNLDVLSAFAELRIGIGYTKDGAALTDYPAGLFDLDEIEVEYEEIQGWDEDITAVRKWDDLPEKARIYVERLETLVGVPIVMLSVGPEREQVIPRGLGG
jgi:adenylosuccinate synthase